MWRHLGTKESDIFSQVLVKTKNRANRRVNIEHDKAETNTICHIKNMLVSMVEFFGLHVAKTKLSIHIKKMHTCIRWHISNVKLILEENLYFSLWRIWSPLGHTVWCLYPYHHKVRRINYNCQYSLMKESLYNKETCQIMQSCSSFIWFVCDFWVQHSIWDALR